MLHYPLVTYFAVASLPNHKCRCHWNDSTELSPSTFGCSCSCPWLENWSKNNSIFSKPTMKSWTVSANAPPSMSRRCSTNFAHCFDCCCQLNCSMIANRSAPSLDARSSVQCRHGGLGVVAEGYSLVASSTPSYLVVYCQQRILAAARQCRYAD